MNSPFSVPLGCNNPLPVYARVRFSLTACTRIATPKHSGGRAAACRCLLTLACLLLAACAPQAQARMALIVGEPFGSFGTMMPQGHAGIYLSNLCVATPVRLRPCEPGEFGAVVSRYHDLRHPDRDWMAFPLPVFLYGTSDLQAVPAFITARWEAEFRTRYWQRNLSEFIPGRADHHGQVRPPAYGDWQEGIGAAFDRRLLMYSFDTTPAQDQSALVWLNDRPNRRSYTVTRHNCADFAADLIRLVLPPSAVRRNVLADFDMTTPKNLAREVDTYGLAHPEIELEVYEIPQLPGTLRRSRPLRGAAESLISQKRYFAAVVVLQPELMLADWVIYQRRGRWHPGEDARLATPGTWHPAQPEVLALTDERTSEDPQSGAAKVPDAPSAADKTVQDPLDPRF